MPSYSTPKRATEFIFYTSLVDASDGNAFKANPTLAAGDVVVSTDGSAETNLDTLPVVTPAGSKRVKVTVSVAEMTGDNVQLTFSDQTATAEWADQTINIQTTTRQIDDLAFPTTSGRSIDTTATGAVGIDWANVEGQATAVDLSATDIQLVDTVTTYTGNTKQTADHAASIALILTDTGTTLENHLTDIKGTGFVKDTDSLVDLVHTSAVDSTATVVDAFYDETLTSHVTADSGAVYLKDILTDTGTTIPGTITTAQNDLDTLTTNVPDVISLANINTQADTALSDIGLDHLISSALPTSWATDVATNSVFDQIADDGAAGVYDRTTDSLQAIADGGGGSLTAQQVWDFDLTGTGVGATLAGNVLTDADTAIDALVVTVGTAGAGLTDLGGSGNNWMVTYTQPTGFLAATFPTTVASTTNITAGTITTVSGNVDGSVGSVTGAVGSVTADVTIDAGSVDLIWDETMTAHVTADSSAVKLKETHTNAAATQSTVATNLDAVLSARTLASAAYFDASTDTVQLGNVAHGGAAATFVLSDYSDFQGAAGDPWATDIPAAYTGIQAGKVIGDALDAAITSRMATYTQPTGFLAATFPTTVASTTNITDATVTLADGAHGGASASITLSSYNDFQGSAGDPWLTSLPGAYGAGTAGEILGDWKNAGRLDTILDTIATDTTTDIPALIADVPTVAEFNARTKPTADYFDWTTDTVANVTTVGTLNGHTVQTGDTYALANGLTGFVAIDTVVDAIKTVTDQFAFTVANQVDANALTGGGGDDAATIYSYFTAGSNEDAFKATGFNTVVPDVAGTAAGLHATTDGLITTADAAIDAVATTIGVAGAGLTDITINAASVDQIWDENLPGDHDIVGSAGKGIQDASSAGDPWATELPGSYTGSQAGKIIGDQGGAGPGSEQWPLTVESGGVPVPGAEVWISTDEAGTNTVAGTLVTDDFGYCLFLLDPGTYYMWRDSATHTFPNPVSITVTA
jgi:hypothetical protein